MSNGDRPPAIVLGTGITALGVLRILARDRVQGYAADALDPLLLRSRWYRPAGGAPLPRDGDLNAWLAQLDLPSAVLIPCSDHWASAVAALDPRLAQRFPASVPPTETLDCFVDKARFAALLQGADTPHPLSYDVGADDAADATRALDATPDSLFADAILKPRDSQDFMARYGVKALHVRSRAEARVQIERLRKEGIPVILQEYVPGPATEHFFVDGFFDRFCTLRGIFARQRLRMYPSDFGNSTAMVSVAPSDARGAIDSVTKLLRQVHYRGVFSAELKRDSRDGIFKLIEINARPWWYVDFAARCGVDVCRMAYQDALGEPVETVKEYAVGRTLVFPYYDYFACVEEWRRGDLSLFEWARSWMHAMQPVFQLHDPTPGVRSFAKVVGQSIARRLRIAEIF